MKSNHNQSENKNIRKNDYTSLKRAIFSKVIILVLATIGLLSILNSTLTGHFGTFVVSFLEKTFNLSYPDALAVHRYIFRSNRDFIILFLSGISFLFIIKFVIRLFINYLEEIDIGMGALMDESNEKIILSSEMNFMETKLNDFRYILRKRKRDALEAEQRKNDLVMHLAHDIRTPLTSVIGYLDLLNESPEIPIEQRAKYLNITLIKAEKLEQLINEFFEITRYNLQTIQINKTPTNLSFMLEQIADEFYPILAKKNQIAIVNSKEKNIVIDADADKLSRVFNNVLKNAIAYGDNNSNIILDLEDKDEYVLVSIKNYGRKIPEQKLNSIFEKFYRLDSSRATTTGNAGLGLAIAKEIISLHGGEIYAESNVDFTIFYIKFQK